MKNFAPILLSIAGAWSQGAKADKFNCTPGDVVLDTDQPGDSVVATPDHDEVHCHVGSDKVGCVLWKAAANGVFKEYEGAFVGPHDKGFGTDSVRCVNNDAQPIARQDYSCQATDQDGGAIATFDLASRGGQWSNHSVDQPLACIASFRGPRCNNFNTFSFAPPEALGSGGSGTAGPVRYIEYVIPYDSSKGARVTCAANHPTVEPEEPSPPIVGRWEETQLPPLQTDDVSFPLWINVIDDKLSITKFKFGGDQNEYRTFILDEDLNTWADQGVAFADLPEECSTFGGLQVVHAAHGTYALLNRCSYFLPAGESHWTPLPLMPKVDDIDNGLAVWSVGALGDQLMVWGGGLAPTDAVGQGFLFDPASQQWRAIPTDGAPSRRMGAVLVAAGDHQAFVFGGVSSGPGQDTAPLADGALFDAATNHWQPISSLGAHPGVNDLFKGVIPGTVHAYWTGTEVLLWGGWNGGVGYVTTGHLYNPATDQWRPMATAEGPVDPAIGATSIFENGRLIIWGGFNYRAQEGRQDGWLYDVAMDTWKKLPRLDTGSTDNVKRMKGVWYHDAMTVLQPKAQQCEVRGVLRLD